MRALAHLCALALLALPAVSGVAAEPKAPGTGVDFRQRFVVVTFANDPYRPAAPPGSTGRRYTGESYGVAQSAHEKARRVAALYSLREVTSWPIKALGVHCVVYEIPDGRSISEVLSVLSREPRITLAQPLQEFRTLTSASPSDPYNDPLFSLQSNLVALGISAAHQRSQGAGVRIGLIDTGVDTEHPDLHGRILGTRSFITSGPARAGNYRHGTAMAGLIAAVANNNIGIVGIAPLARIEVFEACWQLKPDADEAACNTFTIAQALEAALEAGLPLINLSIAGPADPLLSALVQSGLKRGVIFVGSAAEEPNTFPTNIDGVIGVANSDGANQGATLAAPGTHVITLRPQGQYDFESGTSVAAAEITGTVALLLGIDSHLPTAAIVALLRDTSTHTAGAAAAINVNAALAKLDTEKSASRLARAR